MKSRAEWRIRPVAEEDFATLLPFARRLFCDNFAHIYRPQELHDYLAQSYSLDGWMRDWREGLRQTLLAEDSRDLLGYISFGACGLPIQPTAAPQREIKHLYLDDRATSRGIGQALMEAAMKEMAEAGEICLSVWAYNFGAQRFYQRLGFSEAGSYLFDVGQHRDPEYIYRLVGQEKRIDPKK